MDRHFTQEACPLYHNMSRKVCRELRAEINRRSGQRRKAQMNMAAKSPVASPTNDQRKNAQIVKDARSKFKSESSEDSKKGFDELPEDRECSLDGVTSSWDLKLFREAQILAAEDAEEALRGLPEVKNTKYIEVRTDCKT